MSIFTRFRDIIHSNINAMLEKAEDPEKLIKLMIQEMEDTLVEIKASCAATMASRAKVNRTLQDAEGRLQDWKRKAELAISKGREDLAREAIVQKQLFEGQIENLKTETNGFSKVIDQYHADIEQLETKLATARKKHRVLVERHVQANHRKKAQGQIRHADASDAMIRFDKFENRIERMEAEAGLVNKGKKPSLHEEFERLEKDDEIEKELEALKKKVAAKSRIDTQG